LLIEFDPDKNERNIRERGLSFERADEFDFEPAFVIGDDRYAYGETRYSAIGLLAGALHVIVFTIRGDAMRVIRLRRANARERVRYEQATRPT